MKYLLCRPLAGLSDHFNTIQRCIEYSKKFNRILLIDSDYKSTYNFNFIDVFQLIDDTNIIYDSNKIISYILFFDLLRIARRLIPPANRRDKAEGSGIIMIRKPATP